MTTASAPLPEFEQTPWVTWLRDRVSSDWRPGEWNAQAWLFAGDPDNPATVVTRCAVRACSALISLRSGLCTSCQRDHARTREALLDFAKTHKPQRARNTPGLHPIRCAVRRGAIGCAGDVSKTNCVTTTIRRGWE